MIKTDNAAQVGMHAFSRAGLGAAPFKFTGMSENVFVACPGAPGKAGGTCDYCSTGIRYEFHIVSADGQHSKVGCNCIDKVGDAGLIKAYKNSPEFRKLKREQRFAKGAEARAIVDQLIADNRALLAAQPHPSNYTDRLTGKPLALLDQVEWMRSNCGISGITSYARTLKSLVANLHFERPAV